MADYKLVDTTALESNLTSIANAIRTKSGTSGSINFPDGFVSAVNNISTGMESNFIVVGGTSQPSNPSENTIWINTSTTITSWAFGSIEENLPLQNGMVYIITGADSNIGFPAVSKDNNTICVYPIAAYQYINGSWQQKDLKIYQSSQWRENSIILYNGSGTSDETITGGWTASGYSYLDATENTGSSIYKDYIQCWTRSGSSSNYNSVVGTVNPVTISGKNRLVVNGTISDYNSNIVYMVGVSASKGDIGSTYAAITRIYSGGDFEATVDVSWANGSYYVFLCAATLPSTTIYESSMFIWYIALE